MNNNLDNLRWCSISENNRNALRGTYKHKYIIKYRRGGVSFHIKKRPDMPGVPNHSKSFSFKNYPTEQDTLNAALQYRNAWCAKYQITIPNETN